MKHLKCIFVSSRSSLASAEFKCRSPFVRKVNSSIVSMFVAGLGFPNAWVRDQAKSRINPQSLAQFQDRIIRRENNNFEILKNRQVFETSYSVRKNSKILRTRVGAWLPIE